MLTSIAIPQCNTHAFRDSHDDTSNYYESSTTFNLEAAGRAGGARVNVKVNGYWSTDVITLYLRRKTNWRKDPSENNYSWFCELSHSSGGRLTHPSESSPTERGYVAIESDLVAETNFGIALIAVAAWADELLNYTEALEHWYQVQVTEREVAEAIEKERQQLKYEQDALLGIESAKALVKTARAGVTRSQPFHINMFTRGSDDERVLTCKKDTFIVWYLGNTRKTEEQVIDLLAKSSHRTNVISENQS